MWNKPKYKRLLESVIKSDYCQICGNLDCYECDLECWYCDYECDCYYVCDIDYSGEWVEESVKIRGTERVNRYYLIDIESSYPEEKKRNIKINKILGLDFWN